MTQPRFPRPDRVIVKVGSSSLRAADGGLDRAFAATLVDQLSTQVARGVEVILVSSGAVAAGLQPLGLARRPDDLESLQAAASVGQGILMHTYRAAFAGHGLTCGQVLLTPDDLISRERYVNARKTFERLLSLGAVPVVNENDTVATDELRFGDNDRLAALVASMLSAGLLVLLSDVDGVYDVAPRSGDGRLLDRVEDSTELDPAMVAGAGSDIGRGGMASKIEAARIATSSAAHAVIANARAPGILAQVVDGQAVGTWFRPAGRRPGSRKLWIAFAHRPRGSILVDQGAVDALVHRGSSLLAAGVTDARGEFEEGDAVDVLGPDEVVVARGLSSYSAADLRAIRGRSTDVLADEFGASFQRAVIHRDSLVVTT